MNTPTSAQLVGGIDDEIFCLARKLILFLVVGVVLVACGLALKSPGDAGLASALLAAGLYGTPALILFVVKFARQMSLLRKLRHAFIYSAEYDTRLL